MSGASNNKIALRLVGLVLVMGSLSVISVPAYNWFCRVTGWGGVTQEAATASDRVLEREITIRFDASLERGMPWTFKPMQKEVTLRIGETGLAFYEAHNPTDKPVAGTASYNVAPFAGGYYFTKIDCFCFEMQVLQPGETVQMPVSFYVDPEIMEDEEASRLPAITLSYTFHETELPQQEVRLSNDQANPLN